MDVLIKCPCGHVRIAKVEGEEAIPDRADEEMCPQCGRTARDSGALLEGHTEISPPAGFYFNTKRSTVILEKS